MNRNIIRRGSVSLSTPVGLTLFSTQYQAGPDDLVAGHIRDAFRRLWSALPELIEPSAAGQRYTITVEQDGVEVLSYWGLTREQAFVTTARRLRKLARLAPDQTPREKPAAVSALRGLEVSELESMPEPSASDRVRAQLAALVFGRADPADDAREYMRKAEAEVWQQYR
jgi:hypothetical protein